MNDYILLMHADAAETERGPEWAAYLGKLRQAGAFEGGSSIGDGVCVRKGASAPEITRHLSGYIRVVADSLEEARTLVEGNPVYEAGGTVEIRELPRG